MDPLERGPPKRVGHMVENVGGNIAASKKRSSWKFTFGDSDKVHEVVLLHSVMSAKKVGVEAAFHGLAFILMGTICRLSNTTAARNITSRSFPPATGPSC